MKARALERLLPSINVYEQQGKISACPLKPAEYATAMRMGLGCLSPELFLAAITHGSASKENKRFVKLAAIGSSSMKMFMSEYFYFKYPRLPLYPLTEYSKLFLSPETVYDVAKIYGLQDIIIHDTKNSESEKYIVSQSLVALIGALHWAKGFSVASSFILHNFCQRHLISRHPLSDFDRHMPFLKGYLKRMGLPLAHSRILAETGRQSHLPTFLIGCFSGDTKLSEGFGPSFKIAMEASNRNALKDVYCEAIEEPQLPSKLLEPNGSYKPRNIQDSGISFKAEENYYATKPISTTTSNSSSSTLSEQ